METVDWSLFDAVGVNLYRDRSNRSTSTALQRAGRPGLPLLITKFGGCPCEGADTCGAEGDGVVDWSDPYDPRLVGAHLRDEQVPACELSELLDTSTPTRCPLRSRRCGTP